MILRRPCTSLTLYISYLNRFASADTIVPDPTNPQSFNRYSYVNNNPVRFNDPTGHCIGAMSLIECMKAITSEYATRFNAAVDQAVDSTLTVDNGLTVASIVPYVGDAVDVYDGYNAYQEGDYVELGTVAVMAAAPGGGRLLRKIPAVDRIATEAGQRVGRVIGEAAQAFRRGCNNSFEAGTLVETIDGPIPIEEIDVGTYVLGYHEETGEIGYYPVTYLISHLDFKVVYLTIDGEVIVTTAEHPFYTSKGEWVDALNLRMGDEIRTAEWTTGVVESVYEVTRPQPMYNFTVATAHTYFVGEEQWLVHNTNGPCPKAIQTILNRYPVNHYKCDYCADELYNLFNESGQAATIGRINSNFPINYIRLKDGTIIANKSNFHEFIISDGRVYDSITGADGMLISDYKKLFPDYIFDDGTLNFHEDFRSPN